MDVIERVFIRPTHQHRARTSHHRLTSTCFSSQCCGAPRVRLQATRCSVLYQIFSPEWRERTCRNVLTLSSAQRYGEAPVHGAEVCDFMSFQSPGEGDFSTPAPSPAATHITPRTGPSRKQCFPGHTWTVDTFSGAFRRTSGRFTCGRFYSKN